MSDEAKSTIQLLAEGEALRESYKLRWALAMAENERLREQRATLRKMVRIRRHNGEAWAVGFARRDWPKVAEILGLVIEAIEWCPDCGYAHRPEPCVPVEHLV